MGRENLTAESQSHTGCLLNERADELAELGRTAGGPEICPGTQKYGSFFGCACGQKPGVLRNNVASRCPEKVFPTEVSVRKL